MKKVRTKKTPPRAASRRRAPLKPKAKKAKAPRRVSAPAEVVADPVPAVAVLVETSRPEPVADIIEAEPEREFAARAVASEPDRPQPAARRAIFFDVENTSRAEHIARVIDHLAVDRLGKRTDFVAVGNWKVIGQDTARLLARHGAQLVHSAPSVGVRDWSDLRIAVAAGVWLAAARAGDVMEIVTNDRAFDAVGDVAAGLGIVFRRLSYQGLAGAPAPQPIEEPARESNGDSANRRRRRGRRYGWRDSRTSTAPPAQASREARPPSPTTAPSPVAPEPTIAPELPRVEAAGNGAEPPTAIPHTAPHDEIVAIVRELMHRSPSHTVSIDTLANALKSRGFSRTPGSPRLITRLRRIKEIAVSRAGLITLLESGPRDQVEAPRAEPGPIDDVASASEPIGPPAHDVEVIAQDIESSGRDDEQPTRARGNDDTEEPGDSIGNVAQPTEISPPPYYRRAPRNDRRRYPPRPQRATV